MTRSPSRRSARLFTLFVATSALLLAFLASSASAASPVDFAEGIGFSVGQSPQHEAVGDLNGDGIPDLVVTNWESGTASILLGEGDGTFQSPMTLPVGGRANGVVIGDFNGDGNQDLAIVDESEGVVAVFLGNGDGTFKAKSTYPVRSFAGNIAIGDFNGDGKPDLAVSASEGIVSILLNNGDGTFTTRSEVHGVVNPQGIAVGDFNGDGKADIAVADLAGGDVSVFLGKGDGSFGSQTAYPTGSYSNAVAIGDFNGDGHPDLVVTNQFSEVLVLLGTGDGTFEPQVAYPVGSDPTSVAVGDLNGDGDADLAVSDQGGAAVSVLLGDGEGGFASQVPFAAGNTPSGVAIADFNGDGRQDLSVINEGEDGGSIMLGVPKPTFSTVASRSVPLGNAITDTATIEGSSPTGTITFSAYGAEDENCEFVPAFESEPVTVEGNGEYESPEFTPTEAGTYRWVAEYSGDSKNGAAAGACNDAGESVLVTTPPVTMTSQASAGVTVGAGDIGDTAFISGGVNPGGTITFKAYGPNDPNCSSTPIFSSYSGWAPVSGDGEYASRSFEPTEAGTYRWVAKYSGDSENAPTAGACNDANESVTVGKATPILSTQASGGYVLGATISDSAVLRFGSPFVTGTITFKAYGPDDPECSSAPVFTSEPATVANEGYGEYQSGSWKPTEAGIYSWVAEYSGDANNEALAGACGEVGENNYLVEPVQLSTHASPDVLLGEAVHDTATLADGLFPAGTVTFKVFGPDDTACSSLPAASFEVTVEEDGEYTSSDFTPTAAGTYRWIAEYSGGGENRAVAQPCNDANESVSVAKHTPTMSTQASAPVALGGTISDTASIQSDLTLAGTIIFKAYGPDDATCSASPAFTSAPVPVNGDGEYTSADFTPTAAGTYRWVAEYSGDASNEAVSGACNDSEESVEVAKAATTTSLAATPNPAVAGATVTLTAKVTGAEPSGSVTFEDDATAIGTGTVGADGIATLTTSTLAVGAHTLSASYGGDADNLASDSAGLALTVEAPPVEPTRPTEPSQPNEPSESTQGSGSSTPPASTAPASPPPNVAAPEKPKVKVSVSFKRPPASNPAQGYRYTFRFSTQVPGATFYCRFDNAKFKRCKSPVVFQHVKSGRHTFAVKAIAPSGAESATKKASFVAGKQG